VTFLWKARQIRQKRLYIGAVLAFTVAAWLYGWQQWPLPMLSFWLASTTAAILILMAWRLKLPLALLPLLGGLYPAMQAVRSLSHIGRGYLLLIVGFLALFTGVAFNWSRREVR
jgi:hypothetical protein